MFPLYCHLAADTIWGVRKAAADNIVEISQLTSLETRISTLIPILLTLLQDISQWVHKAASQKLGPFIVALMPSVIPPELIDSFCSMAQLKGDEEEEVIFQCAFNFCAVLSACGKELWGKLKKTYESLWDTDIDKVIQTLSCSIHEVAKLVGTEIASNEIVPIWLEHLSDGGVQSIPLLHNAGSLLEISNVESKNEFRETLQILHEDSGRKWRIRETIAQHMYDYVKHFKSEVVFKKFWGLIMLLCADDIFEVRSRISCELCKILWHCHEEECIGIMTSDLLAFAKDDKWNGRQFYAMLCAPMWSYFDLLEQKFLNSLLDLCQDAIISVRITAANALKDIVQNSSIREYQITF